MVPRSPGLLRTLTISALAFILCTAVRNRPSRIVVPDAPQEQFSWSEPAKIAVTHLDLDLEVDFAATKLRGSATLTLFNRTATRQLVLDTSDLAISRVTADGRTTAWNLGAKTSEGQPLTITIEPDTKSVEIDYETSSAASGLNWATAAQSYGRQLPYLYSQNEPNYARSWIPIQDTPSVRMTYDATIHAPVGMLALMSAANPTAPSADGVYAFHMDEGVPAYLIALAVGRLEFRSIGSRTGLYAEPELIDNASAELQFLPSMLDAAERVIGPYSWGRYDLLLMPPVYQYGGMEHPRLNFLNPFPLISGNGPAGVLPSSLVAHEMAHSWAGDQTTLATWNDVWLNEGITSYLTLRILEELSQEERAQHAFFADRHFYEQYVSSPSALPTSILHRSFAPGDEPIDAFDTTSYTKGELFLKTLEDRLGRANFTFFLNRYFSTLRFRWVDDRTFLAILSESVDTSGLDLDEWIYGTGLPSNVTAPQSSAIYERVMTQLNAFRGGRRAEALDTAAWTTVEFDLFLQLGRTDVEHRMSEVDGAFGFSFRHTPPFYWLFAVAESNYTPGRPALQRALERGGPNTWMQSLYDALSKSSAGRSFALSLYPSLRNRYDATVRSFVDHALNFSARRAA